MGTYVDAREKTKENLVYAFWKLYSEKNINKITIKEITDLAGYNRATFYMYFKDTNDILTYVEDGMYTILTEAIAQYNACLITDDSEKLTMNISSAALNYVIQMIETNAKYLFVLLSQNGDPTFAVNFKNQFKSQLLSKFFDSETANSYNEFLLEYMASGILNCVLLWYDTKPFSVETLLDILTNICVPKEAVTLTIKS